MKIAVLCPSEIALRRFMPALRSLDNWEFAGIAHAAPDEWAGGGESVSAEEARARREGERRKAQVFLEQYGGKLYDSYAGLLEDPAVPAVYIPLPPGLHCRWAMEALRRGKHVLVEKPAAVGLAEAGMLTRTARERRLALHENYMFIFHEQLRAIDGIIASGEIGSVRLYRISFGFPRRAEGDFRYRKELGGGALLDCGGYTIRYAGRLLGRTARVVAAQANYLGEFDADIFGSATMRNDDGMIAQLAFGMDNDYRCELEVWGSCGTLCAGRVLTAPAGFVPEVTIRKNNHTETRALPADDAFARSLLYFERCAKDPALRAEAEAEILLQAERVEQFRNLAGVR